METLNEIWAGIGWAAGGALGFVRQNFSLVLFGLTAGGVVIWAFAIARRYRRNRRFRITFDSRVRSILAALPIRLRGVIEDIGKSISALTAVPRRDVWIALGGAAVAFLVWQIWPVCPGDPAKVDEVLACSQINRNYGLLLAGVAALFALYLNWQRTTNDRQRTTNDRRRLVNDTYIKAIEQLGHGKMEVRLGAIYALERIARDAEDFDLHWSIMETLAAYIRERPASKWDDPPKAPGDDDAAATPPGSDTPSQAAAEPSQASTGRPPGEPTSPPPEARLRPTDIAAIFTVLKRRSRSRIDREAAERQRLDLRHSDLAGAVLGDIFLERADLTRANLTGADLEDADLTGAKFSKHPSELGALWDEAFPPTGLDSIVIPPG